MRDETPLHTEIRLFHQLLTASYNAMEKRYVEHYMFEGLKLVTGMNAYALGTGSIPRVGIAEPQPPLQPPTQAPPPAQYEPTPLQGPAHYKVPSAPSTPMGWRSRAPTYGRPDVQPILETPRAATPRLSDLSALDRYMENVARDFNY